MLIVFLLLGLLKLISSENYNCSFVNNGGDRRVDTNKLRIMQYNIEWAFLDYYSASDCPGDGCTWKNQTHSIDHLNHVSKVINDMRPDIINICEIEGCDELNFLINNTSKDYNGYLVKGTDTSTGQNVGMLTKIDPIDNLYRTDEKYSYPIEGSECGYNGEGTTTVSKNYITYFNWNDIKIAFISIHLLAYPTRDDRCSKREGQSKVIESEIIKNVNNGYEILVIGDFNDYDEKVLDLNDSEPTSKVLDIIKGYQNDVYNLTNLNSMVIKDKRYSNWWDKNDNCISSMDELVLIDHILVSDRLLDFVKNVEIYQNYTESCDRLNSDHYPIIIDLQFNKYNLRGGGQ